MNKFIIATLAAISLSATPALANDRQQVSRGNDNGLLIFGGIVVAALLLSDRNDDRDDNRYEDRYDRSSRYDHRGRYIKSRRARAERYQYCDDRDDNRYEDRYDHRGRYMKARRDRAECYQYCDDVSYRDRYGTWQTRRICY